jgi:hypothetical protein
MKSNQIESIKELVYIWKKTEEYTCDECGKIERKMRRKLWPVKINRFEFASRKHGGEMGENEGEEETIGDREYDEL